MSISMASLNLSLRPIAVWSREKHIVILLLAITCGHWVVLIISIHIKAIWVPGQGCVIVSSNNTLLAAVYIYSMVFDFIVFVLMTFKLYFPITPGHSRLVHLIFRDGLIYFFVAFVVNLLATIFILANLNSIMSIIVSVPASVAATIAASHAVRRLSRYKRPSVVNLS